MVALAGSQRRGSELDRRHNIRLHQTAPRELRSDSVLGKPLSLHERIGAAIATIGYTSGTGVHQQQHVLGAVCRGLSGRAAPQVSRTVSRL
jgi:hypothetical protein